MEKRCGEELRGVPFQVIEQSPWDRLEGYAVKQVYQSNDDISVVGDTLEEMVRERAWRMVAAALDEEVKGFLGRERYERSDEFRGYRNGYYRSRGLTVGVSAGVSAVEVKAPRVSDVPSGVSPDGYKSKIVK